MQTLLHRLEEKGYVARDKRSGVTEYAATFTRAEVLQRQGRVPDPGTERRLRRRLPNGHTLVAEDRHVREFDADGKEVARSGLPGPLRPTATDVALDGLHRHRRHRRELRVTRAEEGLTEGVTSGSNTSVFDV